MGPANVRDVSDDGSSSERQRVTQKPRQDVASGKGLPLLPVGQR